MNVTEFRIGNLFLDDEGKILVLTGFKPHDYLTRCDTNEGCLLLIDYLDESRNGLQTDSLESKPIHLDKEWLLKFGFIKSSGVHFHFSYGNTMLIWKTDYESELIDNYYYFEFGITKSFKAIRSVRLDYVHQLQNLYFSLTGEELKIIH